MPRYRLDPFSTSGISPVIEAQPLEQRQIAPRPIAMPERVRIVASDPSGGQLGELIYNTTTSELKIWVNGAWVAISGGGTSGGTFDFVDGGEFQFVDGTYFDFIG